MIALLKYWKVGIAALALVLAITVIVLWRRPHVDPLPPAVRTAVTNEKADRARIDSQLFAATQEAEAAQRRQEIAVARARQLERTAQAASDRADSLAREARQARGASDSALFWHLAYSARTMERDTLLVALAQKDTALAAADTRIAVLTRAVTVVNAGRGRADSVLDVVVASVTVCTVPLTFGRVKCPSRKQAFVGGVVLTVATKLTVDAVRSGRLLLPFRRAERR